MVHRPQYGVSEPFAVPGQRAQPGIGAVNGTFDRLGDQGLRIASALFIASENRF